MSRAISIIHNHNLNVSNVEALAHDLSARFDINIEYGYYSCYNERLFKILGLKYIEVVTILGKIEKASNLKKFRLLDEKYYEKLALSRFGESVFYDELYWGGNDKIPNEIEIKSELLEAKTVSYDFESCDSEIFRYLSVFNDNVLSDMHKYFAGWWFLCYLFSQTTKTDIAYNDEFVINYRRELQFYSSKLGADFVYYVDDQSDVLEGLGEGGCGEMSWEEIQSFIKEKCGDLLLDIPEYFLNEDYRKMWIGRKEEPLAFVDDFRDLKTF